MSHSGKFDSPSRRTSSFVSAIGRALAQRESKKADATTKAILKAATDEMMEFGFRRTTIEDVAKRANVSRMTVYRRFPTKEALIRFIAAREVRSLMVAVDRVVDPKAKFETRLVEGFVVAVRNGRDHKLLKRLIVTDPDETLTILSVQAKPIFDLTRAALAGFIRQNLRGTTSRDAEWAAESALRLCQSFILTRESCIDFDDSDQLREYVRRKILPLIIN